MTWSSQIASTQLVSQLGRQVVNEGFSLSFEDELFAQGCGRKPFTLFVTANWSWACPPQRNQKFGAYGAFNQSGPLVLRSATMLILCIRDIRTHFLLFLVKTSLIE